MNKQRYEKNSFYSYRARFNCCFSRANNPFFEANDGISLSSITWAVKCMQLFENQTSKEYSNSQLGECCCVNS